MNSLELEIAKFTGNGGVHVNVNSERENLGILYLTEEQFNLIKKIFTTGCFSSSIDFEIKNPFTVDDYEEEDIFDLKNYSENKFKP
jgi:hypothetical protein